MSRDPASNQLENYKKSKSNIDSEAVTTGAGIPLDDQTNSITVGARGPLLMEDVHFLDSMSRFDRERIPERVVHAKGSGAFGYFEVTHDITDVCCADFLNTIGKRTPIAVRFSTVGGESGSADSARDPRGFAVKFYTNEGNYDLVGNNTPIFFIRDPVLFPHFIHTQKRNPVTNLKDPDMFWDFISLRPETCHQVAFLFSDRGIPFGYRHMNGYGSHAFKLINSKGEYCYCKFHYKTENGIKCLFREEAEQLAAADPDYAQRDLYNAIENKNYPTYKLLIQTMTQQQADNCSFNPFDLTKVWPHADYPLRPVGRLTLNRNPMNYFAEVEQLAFSPSNFVPGIAASPDKMLQGRLFSYHDTHLHRLGPNYLQIPVNCPYRSNVRNYQRGGAMCVDGNQEGAPNYFPNSFKGPEVKLRREQRDVHHSGDCRKHESANEDNFSQAGIFWRKVLNEDEKARLVSNMAEHLGNAQTRIQKLVVENFSHCDPDWGKRLKGALHQKSKL